MNIDSILSLLSERIGLNAESLGPTAIAKLIAERMKENGTENPDVYAQKLLSDPLEFKALVEGTVVVESWFFRGGDLFNFLAKRIAARSTAAPFRVLSVPCCTGEEPYSLAIALLENGVPQSDWSILGVDLSAREIAQARLGHFSEFSFRQITPELKARYFRASNGRWQINERVSNFVTFRQGNLVDPNFLEESLPFDLIFCRNVMIYLTSAARVKVLNNLERLLTADGLLCMGHSDPLNDPRFVPIEPRQHFLFQRSVEPTPSLTTISPPRKIQQRTSISKHVPPRRAAQAPIVAPVDPMAEARRLADRGDYDAALDICLKLETSSTVSADVYHLLGVLHLARSNKSEAAKCFRRALYLDPSHQESLIHLIHYYRESGDAKQVELFDQRLVRLAGGEA